MSWVKHKLEKVHKVSQTLQLNLGAKKLCHTNMAEVKQLSIEMLIRTRRQGANKKMNEILRGGSS
jgi:hypothetical protein